MEGLSPHARATHQTLDTRHQTTGLSRTRGATRGALRRRRDHEGLSPHARGNREVKAHVWDRQRSIPARAGQPFLSASRAQATQVYPRTRGATSSVLGESSRAQGLSPHARGNHLALPFLLPLPRSIPARAGQPGPASALDNDGKVYPRTRGATLNIASYAMRPPGLSPHARGNPHRQPVSSLRVGSIPARAGQPHSAASTSLALPVYPRTRGATRPSLAIAPAIIGLSPHARGNHHPVR